MMRYETMRFEIQDMATSIQHPGSRIEVRPTLLLALLALSSVLVIAQSSTPSDSTGGADCQHSVICPGEELVYEVSWMSVPLGQVRLKTIEAKVVQGHTHIR